MPRNCQNVSKNGDNLYFQYQNIVAENGSFFLLILISSRNFILMEDFKCVAIKFWARNSQLEKFSDELFLIVSKYYFVIATLCITCLPVLSWYSIIGSTIQTLNKIRKNLIMRMSEGQNFNIQEKLYI